MRRGLAFTLLLAACAEGTPPVGGLDAPVVAAVDADVADPDAEPEAPDATPMSDEPDACADAHDLTVDARGAGATVLGDTTGYANDTQPASSCTGFVPDGPDAIYRVDALAGEVIAAAVTAVWDVSIFIASDCQLAATCLDGNDVGTNPETASWTVVSSGTYYIVVESWDPTAFGAYSLSVSLT